MESIKCDYIEFRQSNNTKLVELPKSDNTKLTLSAISDYIESIKKNYIKLAKNDITESKK